MKKYLFDQSETIKDLQNFFKNEKANLDSFGHKVNQTFEAYTFAETVKWYKNHGWVTMIRNPIKNKVEVFKLKFNTRGAPQKYSYVLCEKGEDRCQIRHGLRLSTTSHSYKNKFSANICSDVAVVQDVDLTFYSTDTALPNEYVLSFGEVKHMSAFAELIANFIGQVHELQPKKLRKIRTRSWKQGDHIAPFLNVSGHLNGTAKGVEETIKKRKFDIDIYHHEHKINGK